MPGAATEARFSQHTHQGAGRPFELRPAPELAHTETDDTIQTKFTVGDHVTWNSEAGEVQGTIREVHTEDVEFKGRTRRCSDDEPQYEIESEETVGT